MICKGFTLILIRHVYLGIYNKQISKRLYLCFTFMTAHYCGFVFREEIWMVLEGFLSEKPDYVTANLQGKGGNLGHESHFVIYFIKAIRLYFMACLMERNDIVSLLLYSNGLCAISNHWIRIGFFFPLCFHGVIAHRTN